MIQVSEEETIIEEGAEEEQTSAAEAEDVEETVEIDINASLLEAMVKRTEILEKALKGEISVEEALAQLQATPVPVLGGSKRRRKRR
ncbi:RNA polymerase subunit Rpo13 [Pyrofollis japonicus]|uniref:RNA polymerase subunit Rpo13 n=1 Tax=Pyrofollis japonicus TaxID=3060460 RepID=UPI00295AA2F7|nr:RNA polymerase subunit Rpo13 [Pyrofollis japonicus]